MASSARSGPIVLGIDHPAADQRTKLVGGEFLAGPDRNYAWHSRSGGGVDPFQLRVCVGRADEIGTNLSRPCVVVGVVTLAGDETMVFLAAHRRADPGRSHGGLLPKRFCLFLRISVAFLAAYVFIAFAPAAIAFTMLW